MNVLKRNPNSGVAGASPTPTPSAGGSSGAAGSTQAATPQKIDYGMGPRESSTNVGSQTSDNSDEDFFKQHGDRIFKHPRFKELNGYKTKHDELIPVKTFIDQAGGIETVQAFYNHLGPIWRHLDSLGEKAPEAWNNLLPILQNFLAGKPLLSQSVGDQPPSTEDDDDPFTAKIKPLEERIKNFEETQRQREQREAAEERQRTQKDTFGKYSKLFDAKIKGLPKEFIPIAFETIVAHLPRYMPKDASGRVLDARYVHSPEAFAEVWEKVVEPRIKNLRAGILTESKKATEGGGPVLPDTTNGAAPRGNSTPTTLDEKSARFAQGLRRLQGQ